MIGLIIVIVLWIVLVLVALRFAKIAGESDWTSFVLVNLIPFAGSVLSILTYIELIAKKNNERKVQ